MTHALQTGRGVGKPGTGIVLALQTPNVGLEHQFDGARRQTPELLGIAAGLAPDREDFFPAPLLAPAAFPKGRP